MGCIALITSAFRALMVKYYCVEYDVDVYSMCMERWHWFRQGCWLVGGVCSVSIVIIIVLLFCKSMNSKKNDVVTFPLLSSQKIW